LLHNRWQRTHALSNIQAVLNSETGMLKDPVLAPLVPWLKTELAWLQEQAKEQKDVE